MFSNLFRGVFSAKHMNILKW